MQPEIERPNVRRDAAVAAAMTALALLVMFVAFQYLDQEEIDYDPPSMTTGALLVLAVVIPVAWRRVYPSLVLVVVVAVFVVLRVMHVPEGTMSSVALFVAIYTVGAWEPDSRRRLWTRAFAIGLSMCVLAWTLVETTEYVNTDGLLALVLTVSLNTAFFVVAWMMGDMARVRKDNEIELALRADQLAVEREARAHQAVIDERVRIARELHDVVAHHVSVMGIQAGAARRILSSDPSRAIAALESIEESGRQAVGELQKLVGFLRAGDEVDASGPQPTLDELDHLLEQISAAGLPVEHRVIGRPRPIPDSVALSAYRIIQESLTNALKHAGAVPTHVVVTFTRGTIDIEVVNRRGVGNAKPGGGRGLVGMRERVAMLGGSFTSGITSDGGYRVSASLPTGTAYDTEAVSS